MAGFWVFVGLLVVEGAYGVSLFNKMVGYRQEVESAWGQIDLQLKRRHDLIPNLVETVKGVMNFEKDTLTQVLQARHQALAAADPRERIAAESQITGGLGRLMAVWENYPDLKANQNATRLQEELTSTENRLSYARGYYNDLVTNFNTLVVQFPAALVAGLMGFEKREFF